MSTYSARGNRWVSGMIIGCIAICLCGCGFFGADSGLEKDQKELNGVLKGMFVTYWKGGKLTLRSLPIGKDTQDIDFNAIELDQSRRFKLGKHLSRIYNYEDLLKETDDRDKEAAPLTATEFMAFAKELYQLSDTIEGMDEDSFPTVVEIFSYSRQALKKEPLDIPKEWNNSLEHWVFAMLMEARFGFGSWKTYELNRVVPGDLATTDLMVLAAIHKGFDHLRNQWFFLSDQAFSETLALLDGKEITLQPNTKLILSNFNSPAMAPEERFRLQTRALVHLLRGFARYKTEDKTLQALVDEDIESALSDFAAAGVDNELVWLGQSYLYTKQEDTQKAVASLSKLENSTMLSEREQKLIGSAKTYVQERDPHSALNVITDKVVMYRIGMNYAMSYIREIDWLKLLENSAEGRRISARFTEMQQIYQKVKKYLDVDELKNKGKNLFK